MAPPPPIILDAQAVSGITGSISIACWIIVFAPQIYENFTRKSAEGLSFAFVTLWLAGDVFNVIGSIMQGVLPTMIILAVYYTLADVVLLWQCLAYGHGEKPDPIHLLPANPLHEDMLETALMSDYRTFSDGENDSEATPASDPTNKAAISKFKAALIQTLLVASVIFSGLVGWYFSYVRNGNKHHEPENGTPELVYDPLAQVFGWLCAILYLGSRVPQILLNFERKSCEGISFMFFLFACLGNLTYVISILSIDTSWYYIWVNSSWLAGSLGTLFMDFTIFVQFFLYSENQSQNDDISESIITSSSESYNAA